MPEMEVVSAYKYFLKKKIKSKFKLNTIAYRLVIFLKFPTYV